MTSLISLILIFTLINFSYADDFVSECFPDGDYTCCSDKTSEAPFWVSDSYLQGEKQYENFRDVKNDEVYNQYIPKGTIVYTPPELYDLETSEGKRLPFKVLSVPKDHLEVTADNTDRQMFKRMFAGTKQLKRAKKGDIGFLNKRSIRSVSKYTFIVKENAPAFQTPNGTILKNKELVPQMWGDEFLINRCCLPKSDNAGEGSEVCFEGYNFKVNELTVNKQGGIDRKEVDTAYLSMASCEFISYLQPIPKLTATPLGRVVGLLEDSAQAHPVFKKAGVENLELVYKNNRWSDSQLLSKPNIKLMKFPLEAKTGHAPYNMRHYVPDDEGNTDAFIKPYAACAMLQIAKAFEKVCKGDSGCQVQFGNMFHKKDWNTHASHYGGECIDIRPFRKTDDDIRYGLRYDEKQRYDQDKTRQFMEVAIKAGATSVFFNDPELVTTVISKKNPETGKMENEYLRTGYFSKDENRKKIITTKVDEVYDNWWEIGARQLGGHDNHIHLCLKEENPRVKNTCVNGIP